MKVKILPKKENELKWKQQLKKEESNLPSY